MVSGGDTAKRDRQQEQGRGVVREIRACRNVSIKHGCVQRTLRMIP